MRNEDGAGIPAKHQTEYGNATNMELHPAWRAFVNYCADLKHGEIDLLKIQDGLPVLAEITRKKVKFGP
jgi:hypothetical protein